MKKIGKISLTASDKKLEQGFVWAKEQALAYVHNEGDPAGPWYEAALPGRNAFCMRDVSHQAEGAAALGLELHTENMLRLFAENISETRDYCTYWEITGEGVPCPDDYTDDRDFWYNHPGSFDVIRACWNQYLWTGNEVYLKEPFLNYYRTVCEKYVERWDHDQDGLIEHYPEQGRRGISSYNEVDICVKAAGDMVASQYAGYRAAAQLLRMAGEQENACKAQEKEAAMKKMYGEKWFDPEKKHFYSALRRDGSYKEEYALESSFLPLYFGILDQDPRMELSVQDMINHEPANVEGRTYYPQILYRCGREKEAYAYLLSLAEPDLHRREYPEVSYSYIAGVVRGLFGILPEQGNILATRSYLEEDSQAEIQKVPVLGTELTVHHEGKRKSSVKNSGEHTITWKACFSGVWGSFRKNGMEEQAFQAKDRAGKEYSYIYVELKPGEEAEVETVERELDFSGSSGIRTSVEAGSDFIRIQAEKTAEAEKRELQLTFRFQGVDVAGQWTPNCGTERALKADWCQEIKSTVAISAPLMTLFSEKGQNRLTTVCSETEKPVYLRAGIHEEDGWIHMQVRIPLTEADFPYEVKLHLDERAVPYEEAIHGAALWWQRECGLLPMKTPDFARDPVYSTWYSYHQEVSAEELEKEAGLAAELGFKTMILDDGWQTTDNNRGYAYCGDWIPSMEKMGDMAEHVKKVHEKGLRYMIWFSVPFVGKYSKAWEQFSGKILRFEEKHGAGVLDLRFPEVRKYLVGIYEKAVRDWDFDGVKLDFIDEFHTAEESRVPEEVDLPVIERAVTVFLREVREALQKIKPEVLVEFRQSYVGPSIRSAGNLVRVGDCPMSGITNRIGSVDIRMLSTDTAVHSDMVMWNEKESVEAVVRQLYQTMFCTLQLSVKLENQSQEQKEAIRFWVGFMKKYREVLQKGNLAPAEPQHFYPVIRAWNGETEIQAVYTGSRVLKAGKAAKVILLNASAEEELYVKLAEQQLYKVEIFDCCGRLLSREEKFLDEGIYSYQTGKSGFLVISRK